MGEAKTRQARAAEIRALHDEAVKTFTAAQIVAVQRIVVATIMGTQMEAARITAGLPVPHGAGHVALEDLIEREAAGVAYEPVSMWEPVSAPVVQ